MTKETVNVVRQLSVIGALLVIGYFCNRPVRFTVDFLNSIFDCAFYVIPFFAIRPVQRLHQRARVWGWILLAPLLLFSSLFLLGTVIFGGAERAETLQTFRLESSTIELQRYEYGGSVGVHGLILRQRRLIIPGLYMVKSIDFFDSAREGNLSVEGPYTVRAHARGNYYSNDYEVDKIYHLKPWVYF